jgi:hypothetical protein
LGKKEICREGWDLGFIYPNETSPTLLCGKGEFENVPKGPNIFEVMILLVLVTNYNTA